MANKREESAARRATVDFLTETYRDGFAFGGRPWSEAFAKLHPFALTAQPLADSLEKNGYPLEFTSPSFWHLSCHVLYHWVLTRSRLEQHQEYFGIRLYRGQTRDWPMLPSKWRLDAEKRRNRYELALATFFRNEEPLEPGLEYFERPDRVTVAEAIGQHHGLPTNLLDFTLNPVVALHFAGARTKEIKSFFRNKRGRGVLFSTIFGNLGVMTNNLNPFSSRLELLLPSHAPRVYQQSGVFVDCGELDETKIGFLVNSRALLERPTDEQLKAIKEAAAKELARMCSIHYFDRIYPQIDGFEEVFGEEAIVHWTGSAHRGNPHFGALTQQIGARWYHAPEFVQTSVKKISEIAATGEVELVSQETQRKLYEATSFMPRHKPVFGKSRIMIGIDYAEYLSLPLVLVRDAAYTWNERAAGYERSVVDAFVRGNLRLFGACCFAAENTDLFGLPQLVEELEEVAPEAFAAARQSLTEDEIEDLRSLPPARNMDVAENDDNSSPV